MALFKLSVLWLAIFAQAFMMPCSAWQRSRLQKSLKEELITQEFATQPLCFNEPFSQS